MSYHIVCQADPSDQFAPRVRDTDTVYTVCIDKPGDPNRVRQSVVEQIAKRGVAPQTAASDLLRLAMTVYSADMGIPRSTGFDSWTRDFVLHLPVTEFDRWYATIGTATDMLMFLTGDHWVISLRQSDEDPEKNKRQTSWEGPQEVPQAVSLFSGGLDSFIGAIDRLEMGERLALVAHYGAGTTNKAQEQSHAAIEAVYPDLTEFFSFYVQPPPPLGGEPEKTTRSRSILFLSLAVSVASSLGDSVPLIIAENGLISINPPLTHSRMGSFSTRTTHPYFLDLYGQLLDALGIGVSIETPYRFYTKGEMILGVLNSDAFQAGAYHTLSCSHPDVSRYWGHSPGQHCGYCVPCIIRRSAMYAARLDDPSHYLLDVRNDPPPMDKDRGRDFRAFEMAMERLANADHQQLLFDVLDTGPVPPADASMYVDVYRRGMDEVRNFLRGSHVPT